MCLGVYLGTSRSVTILHAAPGHLGVELAKWTPPPLRRSEFVYFLGATSSGADALRWSCMLSESVSWTAEGPVVDQDDSVSQDACPFDTLRALCDEATREAGVATIVCDDGGGAEPATDADYCHGLVRLSSIARGNLLFADPFETFPWRVLYVVR